MKAGESEHLSNEARLAQLAGRHRDAAVLALRAYGSEICGFLVARSGSEADGKEIFSQFCEDLWVGLQAFRGDASFRTWMYALARNAAHRHRRDPHRRRAQALSALPEVEELAAASAASMASYLRSDVREGVAKLRAQLDPDDRDLLILRVDRQMEWGDITAVFFPDVADAAVLGRHAASLRKRFERVKKRIRELAEQEGLVARRGERER